MHWRAKEYNKYVKHICISIILLLSVLTISSKSYSQDIFSDSEGSYLGQKTPGLTPEIFDLDILFKNNHLKLGNMHAPDMKVFYFTTS